nr:hypothetical protein [Pseudomonas sp. BIGb0427]
MGGDSIISIQVVSRARQAGIHFTPKQLFQHQTVQSLAAVAATGAAALEIDQGASQRAGAVAADPGAVLRTRHADTPALEPVGAAQARRTPAGASTGAGPASAGAAS